MVTLTACFALLVLHLFGINQKNIDLVDLGQQLQDLSQLFIILSCIKASHHLRSTIFYLLSLTSGTQLRGSPSVRLAICRPGFDSFVQSDQRL